MRIITIDALPLMGQGGISNYIKPLVNELNSQVSSEWNIELLFRLGFKALRQKSYKKYLDIVYNDSTIINISRIPDKILFALWEHGLSQNFLAKDSKDLFLATTDFVPKCRKAKVGWIVYDLTLIKIPEYFDTDIDKYTVKMKARVKRADFIVAISETTKMDIIELLECPEEKIEVVYPGCSSRIDEFGPIHLKLKRPYVYYMGSLARNKNIDGMLRIFAKCVHDHGLDYDIVLSGKDFCGSMFWNKLITDLDLKDRVHITGWLPEYECNSLLMNADMLWQFSWYEGFGLPVLEAAVNGIPVLYTNRGAVKEILRNPEQMIDPSNEDESADRAVAVLSSKETLKKWGELGEERASNFSWKRSAELILERMND